MKHLFPVAIVLGGIACGGSGSNMVRKQSATGVNTLGLKVKLGPAALAAAQTVAFPELKCTVKGEPSSGYGGTAITAECEGTQLTFMQFEKNNTMLFVSCGKEISVAVCEAWFLKVHAIVER